MKLSQLSSMLLLPSLALGYVGGPCSGSFNKDGDCICLDKGVCTGKWKGTLVTGKTDHWPCPNDPNNVVGCIINHCDGFFTECKWTSKCQYLGPRKSPFDFFFPNLRTERVGYKLTVNLL